MEGQILMCNYRYCKILLTDFACVTKCLHIFCQNHIITGERTNRKCHTCGTILDGDWDVLQHANLNPSDDFKTTVLTGYPYKVILDIISKAIHFWDYQINTKIKGHKLRIENMKLHLADKDRYIERLTLNMKHYIKKQQEKVNYLEREIERLTSSEKDLEKQLATKNRQILNFQSKYEELHRNSMASLITRETNQMEVEEVVVCSQQSVPLDRKNPPATPKFVFNPNANYTPKSNSRSSGSCHSASSIKSRSLFF